MVEEVGLPHIPGLQVFVECSADPWVSFGKEGAALIEIWAPRVYRRVIGGLCWLKVRQEVVMAVNS